MTKIPSVCLIGPTSVSVFAFPNARFLAGSVAERSRRRYKWGEVSGGDLLTLWIGLSKGARSRTIGIANTASYWPFAGCEEAQPRDSIRSFMMASLFKQQVVRYVDSDGKRVRKEPRERGVSLKEAANGTANIGMKTERLVVWPSRPTRWLRVQP